MKESGKKMMVVNQHGYSLVVHEGIKVDVDRLIDARVYDDEGEFQRAFCEANGVPYVEGEEQYITEVLMDDGQIYVTGMNACYDATMPEPSAEDAINNFTV